jgi:uncharacterized protein (DUF302 family)
MAATTGSGVTEHLSSLAYQPTVDRLIAAIEKAGMTVFARIDHEAGAKGAGMTMPPTVVLLYGNPRGGTPIMLASPLAALDLPLRVLVREDNEGHSLVSFHPIAEVLRGAGVPDELATRLEPAQRVLVDAIKP